MEHIEAGGARIPRLGLVTWQNTGPQCVATVRDALDMGYRHVDTAQDYGNETQVGRGIQAAGVDRDEVFLTTKVWRSNLRSDAVKSSVRGSLDQLSVDYVDLLLIHWPHPRVPVEETLDAMTDLRDDGLTKHIGVSNFTRSQLAVAIRHADAPIVTDQVLYHPYKDQTGLRSFCVEHDIAITAYSPLARGAVVGDDVLAEIAARHDKTAAQVTLRWLLQQDRVIAIPKATGRRHLDENLDVFDFTLTGEEMRLIDERRPSLVRRAHNLAPAIMRRLPV